MRLMVTVVLAVLTTCMVIHRASGQYIETKPLSTSDTYVLPNNGGTLQFGVDMQDTLVFDRRSRPAIEFGMNWGSSAGSSTATSMFGMSIIDDYPRNMVAGLAHFGTRPARIVAALSKSYTETEPSDNYGEIHAFYSNGIATQVDPEVAVAGNIPQIPDGDTTGALHGFGYRDTAVTVAAAGTYVELKSTNSPGNTMRLVLCNNTNSRVLYGTPTARNAWGDWRNNRDQNGNRIYVTARLRRSAAVETTVNDDSVVMRLQLYDRALPNPIAVIDTNRKPILFSMVPLHDTANVVTQTYPNTDSPIWSVERGMYWSHMTARNPSGETTAGSIAARKVLGTVFDTAHKLQVFDITAGMLRSLPSASSDTSEWVEFSASVEFKRQSGLERGFATAIDTVTTDNPMYDKNPNEETQTINTLSLDVFYAQTVDVDLDWIRFETPHARRILRDEYRYEIARAVHKFVAFFNDSIKALNAAHRILGIRVMEELDEEGWLVQCYMHRLLNGYAITEQHAHPNNRWRHAIGAADLDDAVALPTWHWNGTSNYHPTTETAAPFTHVAHGGGWFDRNAGHAYLITKENVQDSSARQLIMDAWASSASLAALDLKFGMRRAHIDKAIAYDSTRTLKYRVAADTLTDLEVGNIRDSFSTWWNDLSAYEIAYGGYQGDEKQTTISSDSAAFM